MKHPIAASSYKLSHKVSIKTNGGGEPGFPSVRALIIPLYLSFFDTSKIEQSPDCISACDTGLRVLIWNNACRKRYGIAKEETLQKSLLYFFPHMEHDYRVSCLKEWIEGGKTFLFPNLTLLYGPDVYTQAIAPLHNGLKEVTGALNIVRYGEYARIQKADLIQPITLLLQKLVKGPFQDKVPLNSLMHT